VAFVRKHRKTVALILILTGVGLLLAKFGGLFSFSYLTYVGGVGWKKLPYDPDEYANAPDDYYAKMKWAYKNAKWLDFNWFQGMEYKDMPIMFAGVIDVPEVVNQSNLTISGCIYHTSRYYKFYPKSPEIKPKGYYLKIYEDENKNNSATVPLEIPSCVDKESAFVSLLESYPFYDYRKNITVDLTSVMQQFAGKRVIVEVVMDLDGKCPRDASDVCHLFDTPVIDFKDNKPRVYIDGYNPSEQVSEEPTQPPENETPSNETISDGSQEQINLETPLEPEPQTPVDEFEESVNETLGTDYGFIFMCVSLIVAGLMLYTRRI